MLLVIGLSAGMLVGEETWWSLRPLVSPAVPAADGGWGRNVVDRFVHAKMTERGLSPSEEADRPTLIRRLSYDLTGLPPSLEEVEAFAADRSEDAYERVVDRLLASPAYGEHWARHWLDVARYAETHGYDKDQPRENAWPYRDYVIRSLNEDKRWGQFVEEQIAGDVLYPEGPDGVVALGFLAAGPWDLIAHMEVGEGKVDGRIAKHLDRDEMIAGVFNAFMSTTVQCAQCHDHKFDPITMVDYYRLHTIFAAVDRVDRAYAADPEVRREGLVLGQGIEAKEKELKEIEAELARVGGRELADLEGSIEALASRLEKGGLQGAEFGYHSRIEKSADVVKWVQVDLGKAVRVESIGLQACYDDFGGIGAGFGFPVRFRVEVSNEEGFAQGVRVIADHGEADFANPALREVAFEVGGIEARYVRVTVTKLAERTGDYMFALGELLVNGESLGGKVTALDSIEAPPRWAERNLVDGRFAKATDPEGPERLAALNVERRRLLEGRAPAGLLERRVVLPAELEDSRRRLRELPGGEKVYAIATEFEPFGRVVPTKGKPREIRLLERGDLRSPKEVMEPGVPPLWEGVEPLLSLPEGHGEGERRAALARYVTDRANPLTWRSVVNRVWSNLFGRGIAATPNDFGRMGELPTHPELLDWLALQFRDEGGQSLKGLHRLLVTSATYRQASTYRPGQAEIDQGARYLWRMNRRRLSAEEIRDSVLLASGQLDRTMGGKSFKDFVIEKPMHSPHYQYHLHDPNDAASHRRTIYRMIVRSQTQPFLTTLDCADPSRSVAVRDESTTGLQALALMNNPFMEVMAGRFAKRLAGEERPVEALFRHGLAREPKELELALFERYRQEHGLENACRIFFSLSEFVYVD